MHPSAMRSGKIYRDGQVKTKSSLPSPAEREARPRPGTHGRIVAPEKPLHLSGPDGGSSRGVQEEIESSLISQGSLEGIIDFVRRSIRPLAWVDTCLPPNANERMRSVLRSTQGPKRTIEPKAHPIRSRGAVRRAQSRKGVGKRRRQHRKHGPEHARGRVLLLAFLRGGIAQWMPCSSIDTRKHQ